MAVRNEAADLGEPPSTLCKEDSPLDRPETRSFFIVLAVRETEFGTEDGFDAGRDRLLVEGDRAVEAVGVGYGKSFHALPGGCFDERVHGVRPAQEGVARVAVEMYERAGHGLCSHTEQELPCDKNGPGPVLVSYSVYAAVERTVFLFSRFAEKICLDRHGGEP